MFTNLAFIEGLTEPFFLDISKTHRWKCNEGIKNYLIQFTESSTIS